MQSGLGGVLNAEGTFWRSNGCQGWQSHKLRKGARLTTSRQSWKTLGIDPLRNSAMQPKRPTRCRMKPCMQAGKLFGESGPNGDIQLERWQKRAKVLAWHPTPGPPNAELAGSSFGAGWGYG